MDYFSHTERNEDHFSCSHSDLFPDPGKRAEPGAGLAWSQRRYSWNVCFRRKRRVRPTKQRAVGWGEMAKGLAEKNSVSLTGTVL